MLSSLTATRFDACIPAESGKTRPFMAAAENQEGEELEICIKLMGGCDLGVKAMVAEAVSSMLAADLGLPVPEPFVVEITQDFTNMIPDPHAHTLATKSIGLNFASKKLPAGFHLWLPGKFVPKSLLSQAAEILAFDMLIVNDDRRSEKPNCLTNGPDLAVIDHEMAFPHCTSYIFGWVPPWQLNALEERRNPIRKHLFHDSLVGKEIDFAPFEARFRGISPARFEEYFTALPFAWANADGIRKILEYLLEVRANISSAITEIQKLLR